MKIAEKLDKLNLEELEIFMNDNFEEFGMFFISYLLEKYNSSGNEQYALIISKLVNTAACYWEGADFFRLNLYENVLQNKPNSELFLEMILHFGLPPYISDMKGYFDFEMYKNRLYKLNPSNEIFKKL
jgi:hypothetical protein